MRTIKCGGKVCGRSFHDCCGGSCHLCGVSTEKEVSTDEHLCITNILDFIYTGLRRANLRVAQRQDDHNIQVQDNEDYKVREDDIYRVSDVVAESVGFDS